MTFLYGFVIYFVASAILFLFLYYRFRRREKKLQNKIESLKVKEEPTPEVFTEPVDEKIEEKAEELPKEEAHLEKIENPDKDKPFAKISSPSKVETKEYEESTEKSPEVPEAIPVKQKRKYTKKPK